MPLFLNITAMMIMMLLCDLGHLLKRTAPRRALVAEAVDVEVGDPPIHSHNFAQRCSRPKKDSVVASSHGMVCKTSQSSDRRCIRAAHFVGRSISRNL